MPQKAYMKTLEKIYLLLTEEFSALHVKVEDDSALHAGHVGVKQSGGGHFSVLIVSDRFEGKTVLQRHRLVYETLKNEFKTAIHALKLRAYTPKEWNISNTQ